MPSATPDDPDNPLNDSEAMDRIAAALHESTMSAADVWEFVAQMVDLTGRDTPD